MQADFPWIKLWATGILTGSIVVQLTKLEQLTWIHLLLLAGKCPVRGTLCRAKGIPLTISDIAAQISDDPEIVKSTIDKCMTDPNDPARHNGSSEYRMGRDANGCYYITNWRDYQDNTSTSKKLRETPQERDLREQRTAIRYLRLHPEIAAFNVTERVTVDKTTGEVLEHSVMPNPACRKES